MNIGTPYDEYVERVKNTFNFKYYSKMVHEAKAINWNLNNSTILDNQLRVIYSAILELFIEDDTPEMFYEIFSEQIVQIFNRDNSLLFRDGIMNSIFHYDAIHGKKRIEPYSIISKLYSDRVQRVIGIASDILEVSILLDENSKGLRVIDIINANS